MELTGSGPENFPLFFVLFQFAFREFIQSGDPITQAYAHNKALGSVERGKMLIRCPWEVVLKNVKNGLHTGSQHPPGVGGAACI